MSRSPQQGRSGDAAAARPRERRPAPPRPLRAVLLGGGHLAVLWAIAVAQPLFDLLGRNPEFFAVRGSTPREIVLFALLLTLGPPAALTLLEALAQLLSARLRSALHLLLVGLLVTLLALQAGKRLLEQPGLALALAAGLAGLAGALAYRHLPAVRFAATLFLPVPLVVLVLFLFASPVSKLVRVEEASGGRAAEVETRTPVVLIVFDELPTTTLLDGSGKIDAGRFPGFGALAAQSTWFRHATTVSPTTLKAVPAILTGRTPRGNELPVLADHPDNLFTLLRDEYELRVSEPLTHLCPPDTCRPAGEDSEETATGRARSLGTDVGVVYLHLVVPDRLASGLPPVGDTWSDFLGTADEEQEAEDAEDTAAGGGGARPLPSCARDVCSFLDRIRPSAEPAFYFLHTLLPHVPWLFLPSGRRYIHEVRPLPGTQGPSWEHDEWLIQQGYQRHLLQTGYADRVLRLIIERLRESGIYDDALVVVTADHGYSFVPGQPRRQTTPENIHGLAFVPLFVKRPGQERGRVVDGFARTIDIVPTIADALGAELTWDVEGTSLLGRALPPDGEIELERPTGGPNVSASLSALLARRDATLAQQRRWFGEGSWDGVYRIGPNASLLGRQVATLPVAENGASVELMDAGAFRDVDPASGSIPSHVIGVVHGGPAEPTDLAVALNGTVAAVTRTAADGRAFAAVVPDDALVEGANDVRVYAVRGGALENLAGVELEFTLREPERRIDVSGGPALELVDGPLEGAVRANANFTEESVMFRGWAANREAGTPAERIVVFVGNEGVYTGPTGTVRRPEVEERLGIRKATFVVAAPIGLLPPPGEGPPVRVFAVADGVATELAYRKPYPWRPRPE